MGDEIFKKIALRLVDQVHHILGRHRHNDPRTGWISGLSEEEGEKHPTIGGGEDRKEADQRLRILNRKYPNWWPYVKGKIGPRIIHWDWEGY